MSLSSDHPSRTGLLATLLRPATAIAVVLWVGGCNVEEAPEDLDSLFHYFWTHYTEEIDPAIDTEYDGGSDAEIAGAVINAHALVESVLAEDSMDGTLSDFTREEMDLVQIRPKADPDVLTGLFIARTFECDLVTLEEILYQLDQDQLYEDEYIRYERSYVSSFDDFVARDEGELAWRVEFEREFIPGSDYSTTLNGGLRYVPDQGEDTTPYGPILMARTWMPRPGQFDGGNCHFDQDYQIEVFYEANAGEVFHLYGMWRYAGDGISDTGDGVVQWLVLDGMKDWDDRTADLCATW